MLYMVTTRRSQAAFESCSKPARGQAGDTLENPNDPKGLEMNELVQNKGQGLIAEPTQQQAQTHPRYPSQKPSSEACSAPRGATTTSQLDPKPTAPGRGREKGEQPREGNSPLCLSLPRCNLTREHRRG